MSVIGFKLLATESPVRISRIRVSFVIRILLASYAAG